MNKFLDDLFIIFFIEIKSYELKLEIGVELI